MSKLFKTFVFLFSFFLIFLANFSNALSQDQFSVNANVIYKVEDSGKTIVTHDIILENLFSTLYATTYTLSLENIDAQNVQALDENGKSIPLETQKEGEKTNIKLSFQTPVVGKGAKRHFSISYENSGLTVRTGEVWEVSIPRLDEQSYFNAYTVTLVIPQSFGLEAYISPKPSGNSQNDQGRIYTFDKSALIQTGITAGFGQFQVFSFNLSYHLENPLARDAKTQIAVPPDTAYQKVYFSKITPKPENVLIDADGNWLATYNLKPRQRVDIVVTGTVQIFASFRPFPKPSAEVISENLKETEFWQVNDSEIKALAAELKTPRAIYDYVSKKLKYDFSRVQPNVQRMGAKGALQNSENAICMEFTDLFVAISRAAGIPAREVNGYAYTENRELQPLSLVADVLHSWPEYYDSASGAWIPVDPTWASTTGGVDFFTKLDLRHFNFVMHGESAVKPYAPGSYKLGANPQKDVFVSFGKLSETRNSTPSLTASTKRSIPFFGSLYSIEIYNPGPSAIYSLYPTVFFDDTQKNRDFISVLPPYSSSKLDVEVPFSLLGKSTPDKVRIVADGSQIEIPTNKTQIIINSLIFLFIIFGAIVISVLIKLKKITFRPILGKIGLFTKNLNDKFNQKFGKKQANP